jgi:hypothetical protein
VLHLSIVDGGHPYFALPLPLKIIRPVFSRHGSVFPWQAIFLANTFPVLGIYELGFSPLNMRVKAANHFLSPEEDY